MFLVNQEDHQIVFVEKTFSIFLDAARNLLLRLSSNGVLPSDS